MFLTSSGITWPPQVSMEPWITTEFELSLPSASQATLPSTVCCSGWGTFVSWASPRPYLSVNLSPNRQIVSSRTAARSLSRSNMNLYGPASAVFSSWGFTVTAVVQSLALDQSSPAVSPNFKATSRAFFLSEYLVLAPAPPPRILWLSVSPVDRMDGVMGLPIALTNFLDR